jgi:hypothetical protein
MFTCDIMGTLCTSRRTLWSKEVIKEQQPCKKSFSHGKRPKAIEGWPNMAARLTG